jgi:hypothetical protein
MKELMMSDFAPLGSLSLLDELGPTETTWQPYVFRVRRVVPQQPSQPAAHELAPLGEVAGL